MQEPTMETVIFEEQGMNRDLATFLRSWVANPKQVGAIAPSSNFLAKSITREISSNTGRVLELGPGTGVFTRMLLERGVKESDLTLVEVGSRFAGMLSSRYPQATILCMDAARVAREHVLGGQAVGAVVSGLPLLAMPMNKRIAVVAGAFNHLRPGGALYQFTYGLRFPIPQRILDRLNLRAVRIGWSFLNIPPAFVYRVSRRRPFRMAVAAG